MKSGSESSEQPMGTTRASEAFPAPPDKLSEAECLEQQAEQAKEAMTQTLRSMGNHLGQALDARKLSREHPLLVIGGAAVAGLVAIRLIQGPRKPQEAGTSDNHRNGRDVDDEAPRRRRRGAVLGRRLMRSALRLLQPAITGFVMSQLRPVGDKDVGDGVQHRPDSPSPAASEPPKQPIDDPRV